MRVLMVLRHLFAVKTESAGRYLILKGSRKGSVAVGSVAVGSKRQIQSLR